MIQETNEKTNTNLTHPEIKQLKTVPDTEQYYRDNHKKYPTESAELTKRNTVR